MGEFIGKYRAIVLDINDPEERGRLLLQCPSLNETDVFGWAEASLPPGVFILPEKGDAVYLEFEEGDINYPVWTGVLPTKTYMKRNFFPGAYDPTKKFVLGSVSGNPEEPGGGDPGGEDPGGGTDVPIDDNNVSTTSSYSSSKVEADFAKKNHDHNGVYAPVDHNHDTRNDERYAKRDHTHAGQFAPASHAVDQNVHLKSGDRALLDSISGGAIGINDGATSTTTTFSSSKISFDLSQHATDEKLHLTAEQQALLERASQDSLKVRGRLWTDFASRWVRWYGLADLNVTDPNLTGAKSIRISTDTTPENGTSAIQLRDTMLDLSKIKSMMIRFFVSNAEALSKFEIRFSSTNFGSGAGYLSWQLSRWKMSRGWNEAMVPLSALTVSGAENINNIMNAIQISVTGTGGSVVFDRIQVNKETRPTVIFRFDDGWKSQFTKAFPILHSKGFVGTVGAISNYVGTTNYATKAELLELQSYGWNIFNHTANHQDLTTIVVEDIPKEINGCRDWLNANGFPEASNIVAYPYGSFNDNVLAAMQGYRLGLSVQEDLEVRPPISPFAVKTLTINNSTTDATWQAVINNMIETGSTLILLLHRIEDTGTEEIIFPTARFKAMVDYIATRDIDVVNFTDWLA